MYNLYRMIWNFLVYIASISGVCCYITDAINTYEIYTTMNIEQNLMENKKVNRFSIKIRLCVILTNSCFLIYNIINHLDSPIISYSIFFSLDTLLLGTRIWYEYVFYTKKARKDIEMGVHITNPILDCSTIPNAL